MEVTEENKRKLIKYSQDLFDDCLRQKDYPFTKWEDQFDEVYRVFTDGNMSQEFLDFAVGD